MRAAPHKWTDEEKTYLRENYLTMTCEEIGNHLGLVKDAVKNAASRYGIKGKRRPITQEDVAIFTELYPDMDTKELAVKMGRTVESLYGMSDTLGVKKAKLIKQRKSERRLYGLRLRASLTASKKARYRRIKGFGVQAGASAA